MHRFFYFVLDIGSILLFIDASSEFVKVKNNNKLTDANIENIIKVYTNREEKEYFSRLAAYAQIKEQGFNLSVSTYVEKKH